ncbi:MAG: TonB-dependent receptor family protein [Pseudomonadales bacterium]
MIQPFRLVRRAALRLLAVCCVGLWPLPAWADVQTNEPYVEEITIVGERTFGDQVAGSAHYLGPADLQALGYSDIQRLIRQVPGVSVQVEDGYGLRPNISIRGVATERSGRITLLEDNVLIAPAPYSAPSAYYFPTLGRMSAVEVLKGPAAITQGPYTIGGSLNMISTPIPESSRGSALLEAGEDSTYRLHAHYGSRLASGFGFLLETHQWRSDGFQDIDRGGDSGLNLDDYTLKLSYAPNDSRHSIELKLQYADQDSDQSYLGLSDADFSGDGFRRYGISALDNIGTEHKQAILRYDFSVNENLTLGALAYYNEHERDWFKTEGIDFDGSSDAQSFARTSWFNVVQAVNSGTALGGLSATQLQSILDGSVDTAPGSIQLRSNARTYESRGLQLGLEWRFETGAASHEVQFGARYHEDEEDRLQRNSTYSQVNGTLQLDDLGLLGNAGNRLQEAEALALFVYDRIEIGNWTFTPGLRFEDIDQQRTRWEIRSGRTNDPASRAANNFRDDRDNHTQVWLPGMGVVYQLNDNTAFFGGVHKGFTAPSNAPGVDEEKAINTELGVRWQAKALQAEAAYFRSDYDNLLGECTASSGTDCVVGDAFNGDAATVQGIELLVHGEFNRNGNITLPFKLAYTYIDGEFDSNVADTDFFGDVTKGDPIPYIPEQQASATLGLANANWTLNLSASYVDEVCVRASCNAFEKTDDSLTFDLAGSYRLSPALNLFARIENLTAEEDIVGRHPYGARPNKDRTASVGVRIDF